MCSVLRAHTGRDRSNTRHAGRGLSRSFPAAPGFDAAAYQASSTRRSWLKRSSLSAARVLRTPAASSSFRSRQQVDERSWVGKGGPASEHLSGRLGTHAPLVPSKPGYRQGGRLNQRRNGFTRESRNLLCAHLAAAVPVGLLANTLFGLW
jgi:hypothetical protein